MDQGEYDRRPRSASRPPESADRGETPLYQEIPLNTARRTAPSGRPDYRTYRPAAEQNASRRPTTGGAARGTSRQTAPSYQAPSRARSVQSPPARENATYTEISWEDVFQGRTAAPPVREEQSFDPGGIAADAPVQEPFDRTGESDLYAPPEPEYARYARPAERTRTGSYEASRGRAPAHRGTRASGARSYTPRSRSGAVPPPAGPRKRPPVRRRGLHPIFYILGVALVVLLIVGITRLARSTGTRVPQPTPVMYVPGSAVTPAPATPTPSPTPKEGEPEVTPTAAPSPTPEPSPTPSGPKAREVENRVVPADWGPVVPQRVNAVFDSHFDKTCMIGNSMVEGFRMWSGLTNIRYIPNTGAVVNNVIGVMDLAPITLNVPGYYTDIYLLFGLNEIGESVDSFISGYTKLVEYIRRYQPTANIYVISVTPVTKAVDEDPQEVQTMERINNFNAALLDFCTKNECWYLDIYSMLLDDEGYLSDEYAYAGDGKHFEKSGYVAWANYMKTHYVDEALIIE
ncbi:MAG: hypothetical protein IKO22_00870 [Oscillospiraceae bacterium]|nr:hypothetical protein [Oscillospiraceae bacterium]